MTVIEHFHPMKISLLVLSSLSLLSTSSSSSSSTSMRSFFVRQSINIPGIITLRKAMLRPSLLIPTLQLSSLNDLDLSQLQRLGVKYIVFDKDNTLSLAYEHSLHDSVKLKVREAQLLFPGAVSILSNSVGTTDDADNVGATLTEKDTGIPVIIHKKKKPSLDLLPEIVQHYRTTAMVGHISEPSPIPILCHEICMVGDRLLTDIVFANQLGMISVLVDPIDAYRDHPVAVVLRCIERNLILPLAKLIVLGRMDKRDLNIS